MKNNRTLAVVLIVLLAALAAVLGVLAVKTAEYRAGEAYYDSLRAGGGA